MLICMCMLLCSSKVEERIDSVRLCKLNGILFSDLSLYVVIILGSLARYIL